MNFQPRTYAAITTVIAGMVVFYIPFVTQKINFNVSGFREKTLQRHVSFFISYETFSPIFLMLIYHLRPWT